MKVNAQFHAEDSYTQSIMVEVLWKKLMGLSQKFSFWLGSNKHS